MRSRLVLAVSAFALIVAACGGGSQVVATVSDGDLYTEEITSQLVEDLSTANVLSKEQFAQDLLNTIVEIVAVERAESDYDLTFTDEEIRASVDDIILQIESQGQGTYEEFLEAQGFTEDRISRIAHQQLVASGVTELLVEEAGPVSDEEIEAFVDGTVRGQTEACVAHILLENEEDALAALDRVQGGEDFAEVATDVSTGPSGPDGGDLGCATLGNYVEEFAVGAYEAEVGVPTDPVRSSFGFHLILVNERTLPADIDMEQIRDNAAEVLNSTRGQPLVNDWLLQIIEDAEVSIDPEFGTWVTQPSPQVIPPA